MYFIWNRRFFHAYACSQRGLLYFDEADARRTVGLNLNYFTSLWGVSRSMQYACLFSTSQRTTQPAWMFCLALSSAALITVGRRGGFSSLSFPDVTVTVGFFPSGCFRRCSPFVDLFRDIHSLKHSTSFLVSFPLKIPSLKIGLFHPFIWNCMQENLIELFMCNFLGDVQSST